MLEEETEEVTFYDKNMPVPGLEDYLVKQEVLKDLTEKMEKLTDIKLEKIHEYKIIYDELEILRTKKRSLIKLRNKISRCIFFEKSLNTRILEIPVNFSEKLASDPLKNNEAGMVLEAIFYFLKEEKVGFEEITKCIQKHEFLPLILNFSTTRVSEKVVAYMKENYMDKEEIKKNCFVGDELNFWMRLILDWMISRILFNSYDTQMQELDTMIARVNSEKFHLENDEIMLRNLIGEIIFQIDSLQIRCIELKEAIETTIGEETARFSIQNHIRNGNTQGYDISEILTRRFSNYEAILNFIPTIIKMFWLEEGRPQHQPTASSNNTKTLGEDWKLPTIDNFSQCDERLSKNIEFIELKDQTKNDIRKSFNSTFNKKLNEELQKIKQELLAENTRSAKKEMPKNEKNLDEFYLKLLGKNTGEENGTKKTNHANCLFKTNQEDFEQIDVSEFSDNLSENKQTKSQINSLINSKNILKETGFSKFDALINHTGTSKSQFHYKFSDESNIAKPFNYNEFQATTFSYLDKQQVSTSDIPGKNDLFKRIDEQIKNDAMTIEKYRPSKNASEEPSESFVSTNSVQRKRPAKNKSVIFKSEIFFKPKGDSFISNFTSFKPNELRNSGSEDRKSGKFNNTFLVDIPKANSTNNIDNFHTFNEAVLPKFKYTFIVDQYIQQNLEAYLKKEYFYLDQKQTKKETSSFTEKKKINNTQFSIKNYKLFENRKTLKPDSEREITISSRHNETMTLQHENLFIEPKPAQNYSPVFNNCSFMTMVPGNFVTPYTYTPATLKNPQNTSTEVKPNQKKNSQFKNVIFQNADSSYSKKGSSLHPTVYRGDVNYQNVPKYAFLKSQNLRQNIFPKVQQMFVSPQQNFSPQKTIKVSTSSFLGIDNMIDNNEHRSSQTFKNSFNEKTSRDTIEKGLSQERNFTIQKGNFQMKPRVELYSSPAENTPISMKLNGKEVCLVRVDNNVNVYRYKEEINR